MVSESKGYMSVDKLVSRWPELGLVRNSEDSKKMVQR